jgi:hypothetical protein
VGARVLDKVGVRVLDKVGVRVLDKVGARVLDKVGVRAAESAVSDNSILATGACSFAHPLGCFDLTSVFESDIEFAKVQRHSPRLF